MPNRSPTPAEWYLLFDECREKKETITPNSRKIIVDLERVRKGWGEVSIGVDAFYERCRPMVEASRRVVEALLAAHPDHTIDMLYLTGGGSEVTGTVMTDSFPFFLRLATRFYRIGTNRRLPTFNYDRDTVTRITGHL
jgi:hypothetical protein